MDSHTLELLDFDKVQALVAARAACSLGKASGRVACEPSRDPGEIHSRQALTTEMAEALAAGLRPPFGGLHDIRHHVGAVLMSAASSSPKRWPRPSRLFAQSAISTAGSLSPAISFPRLGGLRAGVGEFSGVAAAIEGCLDNRGTVLDTASRRLSALQAGDRPPQGANSRDASADAPLARDQTDPPLPQLLDRGPSLRAAGRQGQARRDPGLGPPHQLEQRDRLHRARRRGRAVGPALVPARGNRKRFAGSCGGSARRSLRSPNRSWPRSKPWPIST